MIPTILYVSRENDMPHNARRAVDREAYQHTLNTIVLRINADRDDHDVFRHYHPVPRCRQAPWLGAIRKHRRVDAVNRRPPGAPKHGIVKNLHPRRAAALGVVVLLDQRSPRRIRQKRNKRVNLKRPVTRHFRLERPPLVP